jgi:WD40 repeat protein
VRAYASTIRGRSRARLFSPGGKLVVTAAHDGIARIWDGVTGSLVRQLGRGQNLSLLSAAFSPEGSLVLPSTAPEARLGCGTSRAGGSSARSASTVC